MRETTVYGFCLAVAFAAGAALTHGQVQQALTAAAVCATAALAMATVVTLAGERAQQRARDRYRSRYGQEPPAA